MRSLKAKKRASHGWTISSVSLFCTKLDRGERASEHTQNAIRVAQIHNVSYGLISLIKARFPLCASIRRGYSLAQFTTVLCHVSSLSWGDSLPAGDGVFIGNKNIKAFEFPATGKQAWPEEGTVLAGGAWCFNIGTVVNVSATVYGEHFTTT